MHIVYGWSVINRYATLGLYSNGEQARHVHAAFVFPYCHEEVTGELSVTSFFVVLNMDMNIGRTLGSMFEMNRIS
ncbi:hypothetical protein [Paenibacillus pabuli]|uniref:hypothetical protein n=1 Tax=Paenibacillus pabuli TaxID=1472 RepID=UPI003CE8B404